MLSTLIVFLFLFFLLSVSDVLNCLSVYVIFCSKIWKVFMYYKQSPLGYAIENISVKAAELLLEFGVDVNEKFVCFYFVYLLSLNLVCFGFANVIFLNRMYVTLVCFLFQFHCCIYLGSFTNIIWQ